MATNTQQVQAQQQHGLVRLISRPNVFVTLDDGSELRVDPKSFPKGRPRKDQRVVVQKKNGTDYDFAGVPNANLIRTLS